MNLCHTIGPFCYDGFLSNVVQSEILLRAWRCMGIATAYTPHRRRSDIGRSAPTVCKYEVGDGTATTGCLPCSSSQYISAVQLSCTSETCARISFLGYLRNFLSSLRPTQTLPSGLFHIVAIDVNMYTVQQAFHWQLKAV